MAIEPNPYDSDALVAARASQDDPIKQYIIVRRDVGMSWPKALAQVGHGIAMFDEGYNKLRERFKSFGPHGGDRFLKKEITDKWREESFRKITLAGKTKDFEKIKNDPNLSVFLVVDAGLTELEPGTETVMVTWPMRESNTPKVIKRLRALQTEHLLKKEEKRQEFINLVSNTEPTDESNILPPIDFKKSDDSTHDTETEPGKKEEK